MSDTSGHLVFLLGLCMSNSFVVELISETRAIVLQYAKQFFDLDLDPPIYSGNQLGVIVGYARRI